MEPLEIVKEIQAEVSRCRENRNLMLAATERNLSEQIKDLKASQCEIKNLLLGRLAQTETLQTQEDISVRDALDQKVSSSMFRWALGLLAVGIVGGSILNYATLRSVQIENALFRKTQEHHLEDSQSINDAQTKAIQELLGIHRKELP